MITKHMKIGVASGITVLGLALTVATFASTTKQLSLLKGSDNPYELVLNSNNAVSTSGDHIQKTVNGADVTFTYTNVSSSTGNHTYLTNGGSIVNKDIIHSITTFSATFVGKLQARVAYTTEKWGEYFDLLSGQEISLGSNPYYLEMKANDGAVTLTSATYGYSCLVNPDAESQNTTGSYDITFKTHSSDSSTGLASSGILDEIDSGASYVTSFSGISKVYAGKSGLKLGSGSAAGNFTFNFNSSTVTANITSIDVSSAQYGTDNGSLKFYVNGSSTAAATIDPSEGGSFTVNAAVTTLEVETTSKRAYLCGVSLNYGSSTTPSVPSADEVGLTASDSHKDNYSTNSVFATDNDLRVYALMSDGTQTQLSLGESGYSYTIKNANNQVIDPTVKFGAEGTYLLTVSYKNYIPVEIYLTVGEYIFIEAIAAQSTKVTYNTADKLSDYLTNYVTAMVTYSDNSNANIAYSNFEQNNLGLVLLNPKGITYTQTNPFGTAGTWTIRVFRLDDSSIKSDISITVNAIPVETITLNETSYSMYPQDTLQLTTTINPNTATNQVLTWTSSNESVATVTDEGLVTAVDVGNATITATAVDGSNVYATCTITVNEKPASISDVITRETTGVTSGSTTYTTWSGKNGASGAVYAGQSAGQYGAIQLRSKNSNSGIITTTSGGKIGKIVIEWNENTSTGNSVDVYGKSTAYSDPANLYGSSAGTQLGTITCGSSTELTVSGDYEYVGVRSYSGAVYLDSITFIWGDAGGSGGSTQVYPTEIEITGNNAVGIGETSQLSISYTPTNTNMTNVTWSSSNSNIAAVNSTGLVTGVAQGSATITATAKDKDNNDITDSVTVTVSPIAVTGVSLDSNSAVVKAGKTVTLVATISPTNATNKSVTWTSSDTGIATVSAGVVTGVAAGTATITVKTVDGNKTATCTVTVTNNAGLDENSISYTDLPTAYSTSNTVYTAASGIKFQAYNCANYSSKMQFRASSGYLQNTEALSLYSITINDRESNTLTVYGSNTAGSFSTEITGSDDTYNLEGYSYFRVARTSSGAAYCSSITVITGTPTPIDPTGISLSPSSIELAPGGTKTVDVNYTPANANQNKDLTWTSSNTSVATVSSVGKITVNSSASVGQSATITATLNLDTTVKSSVTVTVVEQQRDDQTIMIYMCGADLESENGLASGDLQEILSVKNQPDDVNIIVETGGAKSWDSSYGFGISSTKLERWHVEDKSLVKDDSLSYASMGLTSTFQSFLEWGITNYPADRMGVIMWNHGGGMKGVCYDEKKNDDNLLTDEVVSALSGAYTNTGTTKLEWIGYDACLMQVQDIASMNSDYFNYMIASEESESGYGWDYDTWVDDAYSKKTTPVIMKAIVDGFISENGGTSSSQNDQTLSYLDLSYMSAYITAWNNMSTQLGTKITTSNKSSFNTLVKSAKHYADSDYTYFGTFDAKDFVNKLSSDSTFNPGSSYTSAVLTAHSNLVAYSSCGRGAGNSYGLCIYWACHSDCEKSYYYTASMTKFTAWRTLVTTYGY